MLRILIIIALIAWGPIGCSIKPGAQKYEAMRVVDTTGMTEAEAAEARRRAEERAQQAKARDDYERMQQNLRDVQRANRGY